MIQNAIRRRQMLIRGIEKVGVECSDPDIPFERRRAINLPCSVLTKCFCACRHLRAGVLVMVFIYGLLIVGCAIVPPRNPLPQELADAAGIPGIPKARLWGDQFPQWPKAWFAMSEEEIRATFPGIYGRSHNYLAILGRRRQRCL